MPKSYIKSKSNPSNLGPSFRTPTSFRGKVLGGMGKGYGAKFNPSQFRTQHKGGS